jgi:hypothetical protein
MLELGLKIKLLYKKAHKKRGAFKAPLFLYNVDN